MTQTPATTGHGQDNGIGDHDVCDAVHAKDDSIKGSKLNTGEYFSYRKLCGLELGCWCCKARDRCYLDIVSCTQYCHPSTVFSTKAFPPH